MADINVKKFGRKPAGKADIQFGVPSEHATVEEAPVHEPMVEATDALIEAVLSTDVAVLAPIETQTPTAELSPVTMKEMPVNETMTDALNVANEATTEALKPATDMTAKLTDMFKMNDLGATAKDAMAKGKQSMEELTQFNRGNVEAMVESAKVAVKGAQDIASYSVEYAKGVIANANDNREKFTAVKSPTEFLQLSQELAKSNLDELVTQASKFTEGYLKLIGEVVQPLQNRYALAADKMKTMARVG